LEKAAKVGRGTGAQEVHGFHSFNSVMAGKEEFFKDAYIASSENL